MRTVVFLFLVCCACAAGCRSEPAVDQFYGGVVTGVVLNEHGDGVSGATVRLTSKAQEPSPPQVVEANRGGRFRFDEVALGPARVTADQSGYFRGTKEVEIAGIQPVSVDFVLIATRVLTGTVVYAGTPVPGAVVTARPAAGGSVETGWSDEKGSFLVGGLRPGPYAVAVTLPPDARTPDGAYLAGREDIALRATAGDRDVSVVIPQGASLRVQGAVDSVEIAESHVKTRRYPLDAHGVLRVVGLPPGTATVRYHDAKGKEASIDTPLGTGQESTVALPNAQNGPKSRD